MIKITGEMVEIKRVKTGWFSFDHALADQTEIGFPLGQISEWYGPNGVGKSTVVQSLALLLAKLSGTDVAIADFEGVNIKILQENALLLGYDGEAHIIQRIKHKDALQDLLSLMNDKKKKFSVGIVDAIGSISPISEAEGDLEDANMGRKAFLISQFSRRANGILINYPEKNFFFINHQKPRIGMVGMYTPGGVQKDYSKAVAVQISRGRKNNKEVVFSDGSYVVDGIVKKNRWGYEDRKFHLFVLAGVGVHSGLTAMYDAIMLKLANVERNIVKLGDESIGHIKDIIEQAHKGNLEFFDPFYKALENANEINVDEEKEETEDEE